MGVRRKSRARIAALNKAGLIKDVSPSPKVMINNIVINLPRHFLLIIYVFLHLFLYFSRSALPTITRE